MYIHTFIYIYNALLYEYTVCVYLYILCMHKLKKCLVPSPGQKNQHVHYTMCSVTLHKTSHIYAHFWKWVFFQPWRFNRGNVDAVGCHTFFRGLISMFVFGIMEIHSGCIQDHRGCIAPTSTPPHPQLCAWWPPLAHMESLSYWMCKLPRGGHLCILKHLRFRAYFICFVQFAFMQHFFN